MLRYWVTPLYILMNELKIIPVKHITRWQSAMLPNLFTHLDESYETTQIFAFYDPQRGKTEQSRFVGAMMVNFECFDVKNGKINFQVYIDKFEIAKKCRGNGYGKTMYETFLSKYDTVNKVSLCHVNKHIDNGSSYSFWRHMGFHKPEAVYDIMVKSYK